LVGVLHNWLDISASKIEGLRREGVI